MTISIFWPVWHKCQFQLVHFNSTSFAVLGVSLELRRHTGVPLEFYKANKGNLKIAVYRDVYKLFVAENMEADQQCCSSCIHMQELLSLPSEVVILCLYRGSFFQMSSSLSATRSELHTWRSCRSCRRRRCWDKHFINLIIIIVCLIYTVHCKTKESQIMIIQITNPSNRVLNRILHNLPWHTCNGLSW